MCVCVGGVIRAVCDFECERVIKVFVISLESESACDKLRKKTQAKQEQVSPGRWLQVIMRI